MLRFSAIVFGAISVALLAWGWKSEGSLPGWFWVAPAVLAMASLAALFISEERRVHVLREERARAAGEQLKETEQQQIHGGSPNNKTI